ncbi:MAG: hypothetical protein J6Y65_00685 [Eggerthellaceae bacterium]|nr:hypothetical protein [Eggerthellaceae bacterium]
MYCIHCGVELADSEKLCPLCSTPVWRGEFKQVKGQWVPVVAVASGSDEEALYPNNHSEKIQTNRPWVMLALTVAYGIAILTILTIDLSVNGMLTWSNYVWSSMVCFYIIALLPLWFQKPNPVIFYPAAGAVVILFVGYICLITGGTWFLGFAFPVMGAILLFSTAMVALLHYVRRGKLYLCGASFIVTGGICVLIEFLLANTFSELTFTFWSLYPLISCSFFGLFFIFVAICKPVKEILRKKFMI